MFITLAPFFLCFIDYLITTDCMRLFISMLKFSNESIA